MAAGGGEAVGGISAAVAAGAGSRAPAISSLKLQMKKTYKPISKLEVFYTGGRIGVSRDGSFVACPCGEEVKVVDISSGAVRVTLAGDGEAVTAVAVSPDGVSVFCSSRSLQTKWWTIDPLECRRSWKAHDGPVSDMAVDSSGGLLATGSADRTIRVWDVERGYCTHSFRGHDGVVSRVMFHPDVHRLQLISGGDDAAVRVWDLVTKSCIACFKKHFSRVTDLSLSADGWLLLSSSRDKVVNVWDLRDNTLLHTVPVFEAVEAVAAVQEGSGLPGVRTARPTSTTKKKLQQKKTDQPLHFLTAGESGFLKIWKADSATCVFHQKQEDRDGMGLAAVEKGAKEEDRVVSAADSFTAAMIMPDGKTILGVTGDQRLVFYKPKAKNAMEDGEGEGAGREEGLKMIKQLIGNNDEITDLKFIGKELDLVAVATNAEQIRVYNMETSTCVRSLVGHSDIVLCLDAGVSMTGRALLVSAGKDHSVRVWDVETGACVAVAVGHMAAVSAVVLSRKRRDFIISGGSDRTLKVWSLEGVLEQWKKGQEPVRLKSKAVVAAHDKDINSVAIAPNDAIACTGSQEASGRPPASTLSDAAGFLGIAVLLLGADGLVKLWTIRSNECVNTFDYHNDKIWALTVNSKQEMIATGGSDALVNLWADFTAAEEEEAERQAEEELLKDQDLSNALSSGEFGRAIELGFELKRPQKLLHTFAELVRAGTGREILLEVLGKFDKLRLRQCLEYVREWNTNSRYCHVAQYILQSVLEAHPMKELLEVPGMKELLVALIPYSSRHFKRLDRLVRSTFILDYTLSCMSVLFPMNEEDMNPLDVAEGFLTQTGSKGIAARKVHSTLRLTYASTPSKADGSKPDGPQDAADVAMSKNAVVDGMEEEEEERVQGSSKPSGDVENGAAEDGVDAMGGDDGGNSDETNTVPKGDKVGLDMATKGPETQKKKQKQKQKQKQQKKKKKETQQSKGSGKSTPVDATTAVEPVLAGLPGDEPAGDVRDSPADDGKCEAGPVSNGELMGGVSGTNDRKTRKKKVGGGVERTSSGSSAGKTVPGDGNADRVRALLQGLDLEIQLSKKRKGKGKESNGQTKVESVKKRKVALTV
ncbi:hypothetical protein CBR_g29896 [Chara braunii]|uniref:U3 small nucleolar RNA-associated protein 13 C-terminal domain-containing protein n=1 Tax=Chara braunii TaxID=69332 RepID=A0A388JWY6_CHABU|nr:hypothetical protein CBR_g29896 [Chara braunii]|eukprot:GBG62288.1 hypothetical protein CBR_g29896 [Chara braunii]